MKKLQECTTLQEAQPLLRGKSSTFRKVVETAILLRAHPDPNQRAIGEQFMSSAIQEMDKDEEPTPPHGKAIEPKGEHFVKEEELAGGNKSGTEGSEQSTDNTEPYPLVADQSEAGEKPMEKMENTENQMKEGFPPPMMGPPGLDPQLAQQMAPQMPQIPAMNTPQQIQQMQYTIKRYLEAYVKPLREQVIKLTKANVFFANKIKEIQTTSIGIDVHSLKDTRVPRLQETMPKIVTNISTENMPPRIYEKAYNLESEKQSVVEIDRMIKGSGNQHYQ